VVVVLLAVPTCVTRIACWRWHEKIEGANSYHVSFSVLLHGSSSWFRQICALRSRASNRHFTLVIRPVIITVILNAQCSMNLRVLAKTQWRSCEIFNSSPLLSLECNAWRVEWKTKSPRASFLPPFYADVKNPLREFINPVKEWCHNNMTSFENSDKLTSQKYDVIMTAL
jgi:hypothetical protein